MRATFMPPATILGLISPAISILSKDITMPITVPRNPNDGAIVMHKVIQTHPFSSFPTSTSADTYWQ